MKKFVVILILVFTGGLWTISDAQRTGGMMGNSMMNDSSHSRSMQYNHMHQGMNGYMMGNGMGNMMDYNMMGNMGYGMNRMGNGMMNYAGYGNMTLPVGLLREYIWIVNRVPEMQEELSLTDDQVTKLIDLQTGETKEIADLKADLAKKQIKVKSLIAGNASSKEVEVQLTGCAASSVDIGVSFYDTANKMRAVLNDSQKKDLDKNWENSTYGMRNTITK